MGNKWSTTAKQAKVKQARGPSPASILIQEQQQQQDEAYGEAALEAELRAAQEAALRITAGVDLLSQELCLEQQLAALDDEPVEDGDDAHQGGEAGDDGVDIAELDADELAELEGELQELEREVLGDMGNEAGEGIGGDAIPERNPGAEEEDQQQRQAEELSELVASVAPTDGSREGGQLTAEAAAAAPAVAAAAREATAEVAGRLYPSLSPSVEQGGAGGQSAQGQPVRPSLHAAGVQEERVEEVDGEEPAAGPQFG